MAGGLLVSAAFVCKTFGIIFVSAEILWIYLKCTFGVIWPNQRAIWPILLQKMYLLFLCKFKISLVEPGGSMNQILTQNLKGLCKRVNVSKIIMVYLVPMMVVEFILRILPQS